MNDFILTLMLLGAMSSGGGMPFWSTANRFGLMPEGSGALAWIGASTEYDTSKDLQWRWGTSMAAGMNTVSNTIILDQLYGSLRWKSFSLDLGIKHREQDFLAGTPFLGSLSTTAGNIAWSGNSRSLPGYSLNLEPWTVPYTGGRVVVSGSYGDYHTIDNRYVSGAMVHNTRVGFTFHLSQRVDLLARLDHYALWNGTHPVYGKRPSGLGNYLRMVMGKHGGDDATVSDQINVLGDQRGAELLGLRWKGDGFSVTFQHDIPYDDGSGMKFRNFPDGVNTLHLGLGDRTGWVSDLVLEYATTMWQSGTRHDWTDAEGNMHISGGGDEYFNNSEYRSGWTFHGRTAGIPLFFPSGTVDGLWSPVGGPVLGVENNRLKAMHLGLAGMLLRKAPYKLMLTWSHDYGTYHSPYKGESQWGKDPGTVTETPLKQFSGAFTGEVPFGRLAITYGVYADRGEVLRDTFGAILGLRWSLAPSGQVRPSKP